MDEKFVTIGPWTGVEKEVLIAEIAESTGYSREKIEQMIFDPKYSSPEADEASTEEIAAFAARAGISVEEAKEILTPLPFTTD